MPNHGEVVGDEQVGQTELLLQVLEKIDYLGLDTHVECRHRFVEHHEIRVQGECPGDTNALALSARELVWIPVVVLALEPDCLEK